MGRDMQHIARQYDTVAGEYAETFSGKHEKKPRDMKMLRRFARI